MVTGKLKKLAFMILTLSISLTVFAMEDENFRAYRGTNSGGGGGSFFRNGSYLTFGSAKIKLDRCLSEVPGLKIYNDAVMRLSIMPKYKGQLLTSASKRCYLKINESELTPEITKDLINRYKKVIGIPDKEDDVRVIAFTDRDHNTYLLPGYDSLKPVEQAAMLFHETIWDLDYKMTYYFAIESEIEFQRYVEANSGTGVNTKLMENLEVLFDNPELNFSAAINEYVALTGSSITLNDIFGRDALSFVPTQYDDPFRRYRYAIPGKDWINAITPKLYHKLQTPDDKANIYKAILKLGDRFRFQFSSREVTYESVRKAISLTPIRLSDNGMAILNYEEERSAGSDIIGATPRFVSMYSITVAEPPKKNSPARVDDFKLLVKDLKEKIQADDLGYVETFLSSYGDINYAVDSETKNTLLIEAILSPAPTSNVLNFLLSMNADVNKLNGNKDTALTAALKALTAEENKENKENKEKLLARVFALLKQKPDLTNINAEGNDAIFYVAAEKSKELLFEMLRLEPGLLKVERFYFEPWRKRGSNPTSSEQRFSLYFVASWFDFSELKTELEKLDLKRKLKDRIYSVEYFYGSAFETSCSATTSAYVCNNLKAAMEKDVKELTQEAEKFCQDQGFKRCEAFDVKTRWGHDSGQLRFKVKGKEPSDGWWQLW